MAPAVGRCRTGCWQHGKTSSRTRLIYFCAARLTSCHPQVVFQHQSTYGQVKSRTRGLDLFGCVYWSGAFVRDPGGGRGCFALLVAEVGD